MKLLNVTLGNLCCSSSVIRAVRSKRIGAI